MTIPSGCCSTTSRAIRRPGRSGRGLLAPDRPGDELYVFVHSARGPDRGVRQGGPPRSGPGAAAGGSRVRGGLLHRMDAPTRTRAPAEPGPGPRCSTRCCARRYALCPPEGLAAAEEAVERPRESSRTLEAFRTWNRPPRSLGRLGRPPRGAGAEGLTRSPGCTLRGGYRGRSDLAASWRAARTPGGDGR